MLSAEDIASLQSFKPALIFFDIDGTLLNTSGNYSLNLKSQLLRLKEQGVKLAIASGRPSIAAQFLFDDLPLVDAGLFCTGAEIYNPQNQQAIQQHILDQESLKQLYARVKELNLYCEFYTSAFYTCEPNLPTVHQDICDIHSQHLRVSPKKISGDEIIALQKPILKLLLGAHEQRQGQQLKSLANEFPYIDFAFAHFLARPGWLFASVISSQASKIEGFQQLLNYHNVKCEQVMAFGDSHSDMIFLQRAGMGVAMANAKDEVKNTANIVTFSADEDGVSKALSCLL